MEDLDVLPLRGVQASLLQPYKEELLSRNEMARDVGIPEVLQRNDRIPSRDAAKRREKTWNHLRLGQG